MEQLREEKQQLVDMLNKLEKALSKKKSLKENILDDTEKYDRYIIGKQQRCD